MQTDWPHGNYLGINLNLPPLNTDVLVEFVHGGFDVLHLIVVTGVMSGTGQKVSTLSWYPGGAPFLNVKRWWELPK